VITKRKREFWQEGVCVPDTHTKRRKQTEIIACKQAEVAAAKAQGQLLPYQERYQMRPSAPGFSPVVKGRSGRSPDQRGRSCCSMCCRSTDSGAPPTDPAK
jgi:hypothetical protein